MTSACTKSFGSVYFADSGKSSAGNILPFKLYPLLSRYNAEFVTLLAQLT